MSIRMFLCSKQKKNKKQKTINDETVRKLLLKIYKNYPPEICEIVYYFGSVVHSTSLYLNVSIEIKIVTKGT